MPAQHLICLDILQYYSIKLLLLMIPNIHTSKGKIKHCLF